MLCRAGTVEVPALLVVQVVKTVSGTGYKDVMMSYGYDGNNRWAGISMSWHACIPPYYHFKQSLIIMLQQCSKCNQGRRMRR
jgi:hypothetical protein